ncbi:hypothetical protein AB0G74_08525 [Streptomyces sp. NPDC020875]
MTRTGSGARTGGFGEELVRLLQELGWRADAVSASLEYRDLAHVEGHRAA